MEHVRALVLAGRQAAPEGAEEPVPRDYLADLDPDPVPALRAGEWHDHFARELRRFRDGRTRLLDAAVSDRRRRREQQLMRIGSAAWGAGLALLMEHRGDAARVWLDRAATGTADRVAARFEAEPRVPGLAAEECGQFVVDLDQPLGDRVQPGLARVLEQIVERVDAGAPDRRPDGTTEKSQKHRYTMQLVWAEKVKRRPENQIVWFENLFYLASI
jgi:hypothetical protein